MKNTVDNKVVSVEYYHRGIGCYKINLSNQNCEIMPIEGDYLKYVSENYYLSDRFLITMSGVNYHDRLNWDVLSKQNLSDEVLKVCKDKINWEIFYSTYGTIPEYILSAKNDSPENKVIKYIGVGDRKYFQCQDKSIFALDVWVWSDISKDLYLHEDFIRENKDKVDWDFISWKQTLSEEFIKEFQNKVNWFQISWHQALSEDFIREFKDEVYWGMISRYQELSKEFAQEFKDKVDWIYVSINQKEYHNTLSPQSVNTSKNKVIGMLNVDKSGIYDKFYFQCEDKSVFAIENTDYKLLKWDEISADLYLHEDFIRENKDKVNWAMISRYQELSKEFAQEFKDKVDWGILSYRPLNEDFIECNLHEFSLLLHNILVHSKISANFILKHYNIFKDNVSEITLKIHLNPYKKEQKEMYAMMADDNSLCLVSKDLRDRVCKEGKAYGDNNKLFNKFYSETITVGLNEEYKLVVYGDHKYTISQILKLIDTFDYTYHAVYPVNYVVELREEIYDDPINFLNACRDRNYYMSVRLSEEFLIKNQHSLTPYDWTQIVCNQKHLTEDFYRKFKDKIDFTFLCYNKRLSEEFIEEFIDKFDGLFWAVQTHLSENFCEKYLCSMNQDIFSQKDALIYQTNLSPQFVEKYKHLIQWDNVKALAENNYFEYQRFFEQYEYLYEKSFKDKFISQMKRLWKGIHRDKSFI